ncbi:MAG: hypothetical protein HUU29_08900 [Planctomycetaceae bacterium]|nr:hypothetical protein [Planctomycetaceae bacterium]
MEPETQQPERSPRKRRLKRVAKWLGFVLLLGAVGLVGVESWRQYRISEAVGEYEVLLAEVDKRILKGQTPEEYFRNRVEGTNGWHVFDQMRKKVVEIEKELDATERPEDADDEWEKPSLDRFTGWAGCQIDGEDPTHSEQLTDADLWFYLDKSFPLVGLASSLKRYDVVAELPSASLKNSDIMPTIYAVRTLQARVVALHHLKIEKAEVWDEFLAVIALTEKMVYPIHLVDLMISQGIKGVAWELASYIATHTPVPSHVLAEVARYEPEHGRLLRLMHHACAGEPIATKLWLKTDEWVLYAGWFDWIWSEENYALTLWHESPSQFSYPLEARKAVHTMTASNLYALTQIEHGSFPEDPPLEPNEWGKLLVISWSKMSTDVKFKAREIDLNKCAVKIEHLRRQKADQALSREDVESVLKASSGIEAVWKPDSLELRMIFDDVSKQETDETSEEAFRKRYPGISLPLK